VIPKPALQVVLQVVVLARGTQPAWRGVLELRLGKFQHRQPHPRTTGKALDEILQDLQARRLVTEIEGRVREPQFLERLRESSWRYAIEGARGPEEENVDGSVPVEYRGFCERAVRGGEERGRSRAGGHLDATEHDGDSRQVGTETSRSCHPDDGRGYVTHVTAEVNRTPKRIGEEEKGVEE
jgi:hypothetical protein